MSKSKLLLTAIAMTLSSSLYAQNHKFAGTVVDANGEPIIGATVNVKGSKENAITDIDGRFSISAAPGQTLVINYIGFSPLETKAADNMQLTLNEDRQTLNDVVVVGYGVQKKSVVRLPSQRSVPTTWLAQPPYVWTMPLKVWRQA